MKVLVIGGVAAGTKTAAKLKRVDRSIQVTIITKDKDISYAGCGLPYYVGGLIESRDELIVNTPQKYAALTGVEVLTGREAVALDSQAKTVRAVNADTGEEEIYTYDACVIATGASAILPDMSGVGLPGVFKLRTPDDAIGLRAFVQEKPVRRAVVAGGGFIGLELAENLKDLGIDVTIVQRPKQLMNPFDADMASFIHNEMRKHGVKLLLGRTVEGFEEKGETIRVLLKDEQPLHADLVVLAIGVTPDTHLAKEAGLQLGIKDSIVVNDRMETSIPDIYAAGDAVMVKHYVTGRDALISLAGPANKQGRIIADNICGGDSHYLGSQGSSVIKVFDLTAATTGINETNARKAGLDVDTVILSPMNHAGYYPGGKVMTMKVVFEKNTYRLLGAQIVGYEGVDKRIDVLSTAIHANLKATSLKDLDLAYAPPYSSAKDPVNMAGFMIDNIANGVLKQWHLSDLTSVLQDSNATLLDVRTISEYAHSHIEGFKNIPVDELRDHLSEIEKDKPVYVICQSGLRSYIATRILSQNGYDAYNFAGGFRFYEAVMHDRSLVEKETACGMDL